MKIETERTKTRWRAVATGCLAGALGLLPAQPAPAEWYVAGFGGISTGGTFSNVTTPKLGQSLVNSVLDPELNNPPATPNDTITQVMDTSDWSLDDSAVFGGKVGYFFNKYGYSWLGLELEGFTTKPNIKQQTVNATQSILYIPAAGQPRQPDGSCGPDPNLNCPTSVTSNTQQPVPATPMRVTTAAANVIVRYPGKIFQPYAGIGLGVFYFDVSAPLSSSYLTPGLNLLGGAKFMITENVGLFAEYKYNRASPRLNDPTFQIQADYSITHIVGGLAWHF